MTQDDHSTEVVLLSEILAVLRTLVHIRAADRRALTAGDRRVLATLLPSISRSIGDAVFTSVDLQAHAATDDHLRDALGGISPRRLGKLLARCAGLDLDCVCVQRVGSVREGALWRVTR